MRDLKECQAEVFRRSQARIAARKRRRKQALMICVPGVLCLGICAVMLFPGAQTTDLRSPLETEAVAAGGSYGYLNDAVIRMEVSAEGVSFQCTEPKTLQQISRQLYFCDTAGSNSAGLVGEAAVENNGGWGDGLDVMTRDEINMGTATSGYKIILVTEAGRREEYLLSGNMLLKLTTGQSRVLSDGECGELRELLELAGK